MNIRWIVVFSEVAADGSFIRAATRLNVAQPWLSAQVQRLEAECGVKLFERLSTGLQLTPEGKALLPFAKQVAEGTRLFRNSAREMGDVRNKTVRVGTYLPMMQIKALHRLNGNFSVRYSHYSIVVETFPPEEMVDRLVRGELDFAATITPLSEREDLELDVIELSPVTPYLLLNRANGAVKSLQGLTIATPPVAGHPLLLRKLIAVLEDAGAEVRNAPESDPLALAHLVRNHGVGALMLQGEREEFDADPDLVVRLLPDAGARHVLIRIAGRNLARAAERYWANARAEPEMAVD